MRRGIVAFLLAWASVPSVAVADQGIAIGTELAVGGRVTPGGPRVRGAYLYQLSASDWFEGSIDFTFGGGGAGCFRDRAGQTLCDHSALDGFSSAMTLAVRRYFQGGLGRSSAVSPFVRVGLAGKLISFNDDDVRGFAVPIVLGAGARFQLSEKLAISGGVGLEAGIGWFDSGLGREPVVGASVGALVEFSL